jgi:hypothetical protein
MAKLEQTPRDRIKRLEWLVHESSRRQGASRTMQEYFLHQNQCLKYMGELESLKRPSFLARIKDYIRSYLNNEKR